jgi:putative methyltransferase
VVIETLKCERSYCATCFRLVEGVSHDLLMRPDKSTLQQLLTTVPLSSLERLTFPRKVPRHVPSSSSLLLVLTHDLLYSPRGVEASDKWPPKQALTRHQARLKAELVRLQLKAGVSRKEDLAKSSTEVSARYVRWNPNVDLHRSGDWSIEALFSHLKKKGFERITEPVYPVTKGKFFMDPHLPDCLLVFPPSTNWWVDDKWYEAGAVILQDKASCFPAKVLMEGWTQEEGECIDAT